MKIASDTLRHDNPRRPPGRHGVRLRNLATSVILAQGNCVKLPALRAHRTYFKRHRQVTPQAIAHQGTYLITGMPRLAADLLTSTQGCSVGRLRTRLFRRSMTISSCASTRRERHGSPAIKAGRAPMRSSKRSITMSSCASVVCSSSSCGMRGPSSSRLRWPAPAQPSGISAAGIRH